MTDFMTSRKTLINQEKEYWNKAAHDPDVATKYISDIDTEKCLAAFAEYLFTGSILEIGCGIGRLTEPMQQRAINCQLHGIDFSADMLALAPKSKVKYNLCDGTGKIPYPDQSFDSIYSVLTFQHVNKLVFRKYIYQAYRTLKNSGIFRFQFIEGDHDGFVDHNHKREDVIEYLRNAGFTVSKIDQELIHEQWTWITGIKYEN